MIITKGNTIKPIRKLFAGAKSTWFYSDTTAKTAREKMDILSTKNAEA